VADPQAPTLAEIVAALRAGEGRSPGLLPVPPMMIAAAARALGRHEEWQRIGGAQVADPSKLLKLGWRPAIGTRDGLAALAQAAAAG
jgi:UDP-glucose 4-epimerase